MLQIKGVTKSYTTGDFKQTALDNISLNFRQNEFVAILGPSGSGKTTFLNMVGGLDRYDSGDMIINGKSTKDFKDRDWDAHRNNSVGFIFQSYNLITHLSIVDNVEMGMTLSGVPASEKHKKAIDVLTRVGLKEHIHKRPNQLSGGQMQRVAIARALANDPDIILADEPTGALDTQTSVQIMELIKEIAKDKLVIMVTHNKELADTYAERIVQFKDGVVISDSNAALDKELKSVYNLKKTSMSFFTALKLSGKNISTKKGRTALTAFASSIGIIGIALILSLSNGFDKQIENFEYKSLSGFPILITQATATVDVDEMKQQRNEMMGISEKEGKYPAEKVIYPFDSTKNNMIHTNIFTDEYINYINNIDPKLISGVSYTRFVNMNMLRSSNEKVSIVNTAALNATAYPTNIDVGSKSYIETNYDLMLGSFPSKATDLVLIIDPYNKLDIAILKELGLPTDVDKINLNDVLGRELKVILNDEFYTQKGKYFTMPGSEQELKDLYNSEKAITLKITGVIRANKDTTVEVLPTGIAYSDELSRIFIDKAKNSSIVKAQKDSKYNVLTGKAFDASGSLVQSMPKTTSDMMKSISSSTGGLLLTKESMLSVLGATETPYMITIYPRDFNNKEKVTEYLAKWNSGKNEKDQVVYTDMAETFTSLSGGIMDAITMVLIAFAAVSLVVSFIMIGIITYISVLERTKEIGVLRALGARKKDITRVFNAETFIIGSVSGILGVFIAYILVFPVNIILEDLSDLPDIAQLNPVHAFSLVIISVVLTMLGGAIPAKMAAKKDPVEALRSE